MTLKGLNYVNSHMPVTFIWICKLYCRKFVEYRYLMWRFTYLTLSTRMVSDDVSSLFSLCFWFFIHCFNCMINVLFVLCKCNCDKLIKFLINLCSVFVAKFRRINVPVRTWQCKEVKWRYGARYCTMHVCILYTTAYQKKAVSTKEMFGSCTTVISCLLVCKELHNCHQLSVGLQRVAQLSSAVCWLAKSCTTVISCLLACNELHSCHQLSVGLQRAAQLPSAGCWLVKSCTTAISCLSACKELHNCHQLSVGLQRAAQLPSAVCWLAESCTTAISCLLACKELHNCHQLSVGLQRAAQLPSAVCWLAKSCTTAISCLLACKELHSCHQLKKRNTPSHCHVPLTVVAAKCLPITILIKKQTLVILLEKLLLIWKLSSQ